MGILTKEIDHFRSIVQARPVLSVVLTNLITLFAALAVYSRERGGIIKVLKKIIFVAVFNALSAAPGTSGLVSKETNKIRSKMRESILKETIGEKRQLTLPEKGWQSEDIINQLKKWKDMDNAKWQNGKVSGCVYQSDESVLKLASEAQGMFLLSNPLHPDVFPTVRKMEAEIVRMCINLFNGNENACGTITSGGTESILMACRAAKVYAQKERGIHSDWELVIPVTAHAAFDKAGEYFGIKVVKVDVDHVTRRVDPKVVAKAITKNTILIVGSAPNFPSGAIDPITELGQLAKKRGVLLHVDACLGSFLVAFAKKMGKKIPNFDFSVEGVTSISCDTHKFGFSPKGSSVVMYSSPEIRQCQYFIAPEWTGGVYASPTIAGSRPGAISVATWAVMMYFGVDGYLKSAEKILAAAEYVEENMKTVPSLKLFGERHLSVVCIQSVDPAINIYTVADVMKSRGWNLNSLQYPPSVHICFTYANAGSAKTFIDDLKASVEEIKNAPPGRFKDGSAAIYGLAESLPEKSLVSGIAQAFIDALFEA